MRIIRKEFHFGKVISRETKAPVAVSVGEGVSAQALIASNWAYCMSTVNITCCQFVSRLLTTTALGLFMSRRAMI